MIPYRCTHYTEQYRCYKPATVRLYQPDGQPNPGGYLCATHAEAVTSEYAEKLHETWTTTPIPEES